MIPTLSYLFIVVAALTGFGITLYIRQKKQTHGPMVCPLGSDCHAVIKSEYSKFFGIPVELMGMVYYLIAALTYSLLAIFTPQALGSVSTLTLGVSFMAFIFSLYLIFIQAFTLKQWCTWCLGSASICTAIFFLSLLAAQHTLIVPYLIAMKPAILGIHLLGVAIGLGGSTVADMLFFRFLKDLRISESESSTLRAISQAIWLGLGIAVLSGIGLFLTDPALYLTSGKFLTKIMVIAVIITNGAFLNLYITPKLIHISFGDKHRDAPGVLRRERRIAYALGGISMTSWYSAFILALLPPGIASFSQLALLYMTCVVIAILGSQIVERIIARRGWAQPVPTA